MKNWKSAFSILLLGACLLAMLQSFAPAKIERSKVIKKDFDSKPEVAAMHQYGPLTVKKSPDDKIHLTAEMMVTGNEEADVESVLNRFDIEVQESANELRLSTNLGIESCNTINNKTTLKYKDGFKVKGVSNYKVNMTLEVPEPEKLSLSNKYDKIELLDNYSGTLSVELYSGDLAAANLGDLNLDLKYGKARIQNLANANLVVYDSEVRMGNVNDLKVSSKYSEYEFGNANNLTMETYDEHWKMGNVGGKLVLQDKYSDFLFGNINSIDLMIFDGEFKAGNVEKMMVKDTKYSEYHLGNIGELSMENVFDDDYSVERVGHLSIKNSKYTEYKVEKVDKSFDIKESFDDSVVLEEVASDFELINIDGKYTELTLEIAEGARFELNVNMQYGSIHYPEDRVDIRKHTEKDERIEVVGNVGPQATTTKAATITFGGFDNTFTWN